jgi:deferrochelatase/peroxidase EfeB
MSEAREHPPGAGEGSSAPGSRWSRREVLGMSGAVAALGAAGVVAAADERSEPGFDASVPFYGRHQAGITTAAQDRLHAASFDVTAESSDELRELLRSWTSASASMCAGRSVGEPAANPLLPPSDTGEALGLLPARLTVTIGFGPTLFKRDGEDRFGLAHRRPAALVDLPPFAGDELDPARSGGDLIIQACSDDPQVAFHAVRNLARIGRGVVQPRWSQLGFGRTSRTTSTQSTPRNLQGFKDGTNNLHGDDPQVMARDVWVGPGDEPEWMRAGTYMVTRRIRMLLEVWDRASLEDQEHTIGRVKDSGAPLGGSREFTPVPLKERTVSGTPVIPDDAHIRLAAPATNRGAALFRRGYSFTDGTDPVTGQLDAGLFFICFQRDPRLQFIPVQGRLASLDALNEYISHVGSGIFAVPPGARRGGFVGETLLA